ncbi:MAG: NAD-dependent epimerase, partial [Dermatophilaceae bacterium]
GTETTLVELAKALLRVMDSDLDIEHGPERGVNGVTRRLADVSNVERDLGWTATIGLDEGLRALVDWWWPRRDVIAAGRQLAH